MARKNLSPKQNGNTEEQQTLADEVIDQYYAAKADKESKGLHEDWATFDDYWRGEQNTPEDDEDPGSVTNIVHPLVETQVAELVDAPIEVTAKPWDYTGVEFKEQVERFINWLLEWNRFPIKLDRGERWRLKYGTSWGHVTFDPMENYPYGMIKFGFENPAQVFHDPKVKAPHLIDDAEFVILEVVKPLSWFKRNFPDKGEYVKPDTVGSGGGEIFDNETADTSFDVGANQARLLIRYSWSEDGYLRCVKIGGEDSRVVLYDSDADEKLVKKDNKGKVTDRKPWLKIRKYPLRPIVCYPLEGQVCGMGDVELIKPVQDLINDLDDQIRLNAQQMAWLIWFVSTGARINTKLLNTREAGTVVPVGGNLSPAQAVYALQPKELPTYITARRETAKAEAERVMARPEVNQGFRPEGVNTFGGLALLQQQGQKKAAHKQKMLLEHLGELCEIALEIAMQLFTESMPISYTDKDGKTQVMPFRGSDLGALPKYFYDPTKKTWEPLNDEKQAGKWRIHFTFGQGLPKDSAFQYQALLGLMQSSASQFLFSGLTPEDQHRVRKHLFSMVGVQIGDQPAQLPNGQPPEGGQPQGQPPAQVPPKQEQNVASAMTEGQSPDVAAELNRIMAGVDPAEAQAAWDALPDNIKQALLAQMGGGMGVSG